MTSKSFYKAVNIHKKSFRYAVSFLLQMVEWDLVEINFMSQKINFIIAKIQLLAKVNLLIA